METETSNKERASTKKDIAFYLSVTTRTVENMMASGVLPYRKFGKLVRFDLEEVKTAIAERCGKNRKGLR